MQTIHMIRYALKAKTMSYAKNEVNQESEAQWLMRESSTHLTWLSKGERERSFTVKIW